jgi:phosphodiesterase/alkaline phosphatase D-like protein
VSTPLRLALATAAVGALAAAPPASAKFVYGVASGEVSSTTAKVWTRAASKGAVEVQVGTTRAALRRAAKVTASKGHDLTITATLRRLKPDTKYFYAFRQGSLRSTVGAFRTAPKPTVAKTIRFAWSGDADAQPLKPGDPPFWNSFEAYATMAKENNAFNINLGDTIYSDTEVGSTVANGAFQPSAPVARTVAQKWAKYQQNLRQAPLQAIRAAAGFYSHWDDHEFINDFTKAEEGATIYKAGVAAFRDYAPVTYSPADGLYRSFRWGRNLEVFFLDERSFRSGKAGANHVCDNPQTGQPDLAPTAPQDKRLLFALVAPSLSQPVSPQCLATINDPGRTMLGARQYNRFTKAVRASTATFKVIMNEVPIQQFYALPYDRWEGYEAERQKLLTFLKDNVKNTIFLTTDVHANLVNDARLKTFESGGPVDSGILDVTTGPVATKSFAKEIDGATGSAGSGDLITKAFFKPPPPNGAGMICAAPDVFSYGEVEVTSAKLTVTLKDAAGKPVVDSGTNQPCAPIVVNKR